MVLVYIDACRCVIAITPSWPAAVAGVAYHHAGLTSQERSAVESGYRCGLLLVLCATSTLAAGINLPARRVILRTLRQGTGAVLKAQYLQMIGRAGRAGELLALLAQSCIGMLHARFWRMKVCLAGASVGILPSIAAGLVAGK